MKILLAEDDTDLREPLVFLLESRFSAKVLEAGTGNQAIQLLKENSDIDVIVCDFNMPNGTGGAVFAYLQSIDSKIPYILCSSDPASAHPEIQGPPFAGSVEKPFVNKPLTDLIRKIIGDSPEKKEAAPGGMVIPGFCRVRISSLQRLSTLASDLYLKLNNEKYVKVANSGDSFEKDDYDRFNSKGVEYLYLPKESADVFLEKLTREILTLKNALSKSPRGNRILSKKIQTVVYELSQDLGFTKEIQDLTKANVDLALGLIESTPELFSLLKDIFRGEDSYISAHSVALASVACGLAAQMEWPSENTLFKLALAAFLHDIPLKKQELAQLRSEEHLLQAMLQGAPFSEQDVADFKDHPKQAADLARQFKDIPPDVDTIVAQHHELSDGKGFPNRLNHTRIAPLACVFIVAHDIVSEYWVKKDAFDLGAFLQEKSAVYGVGHFKKIAMNLVTNNTAAAV